MADSAEGSPPSTVEHQALIEPKTALGGLSPISRGCSAAIPLALDRNAPQSWQNGRAAMLRSIWIALAHRPRRLADSLFALASAQSDRAWSTQSSTQWDYWIPRWRGFSKAERRGHIAKTILPALHCDFSQRPDILPTTRSPIGKNGVSSSTTGTEKARIDVEKKSMPDFLRQAIDRAITAHARISTSDEDRSFFSGLTKS